MTVTSLDAVVIAVDDAGTAAQSPECRANDLQHLVLLQHAGANDVVIREGCNLVIVTFNERVCSPVNDA